jgi:polyisoprenoid-binding protein YceI
MKTFHKLSLLACAALAPSAWADPVHYTVDPTHTYVSFETPHIQSISFWRGKFDHTESGSITLDTAAQTGSVDIVIDTSSIDFGNEKLNEHTRSADFFDVTKFPTAEFKGDIKFDKGAPSKVVGKLSLHGVTRHVTLGIRSFKCIQHPMLKREVCGADAAGRISRSDFGIDKYVDLIGSANVKLAIQVEALKDEPAAAAPEAAPAAAPAAPAAAPEAPVAPPAK